MTWGPRRSRPNKPAFSPEQAVYFSVYWRDRHSNLSPHVEAPMVSTLVRAKLPSKAAEVVFEAKPNSREATVLVARADWVLANGGSAEGYYVTKWEYVEGDGKAHPVFGSW